MVRDFKLTDSEFQCLREITYDHIGVNLTEAKRALVISRLSKRLRQLGMKSFQEYCNYSRNNSEELEVMANLITTNVTKFFRESHHFDYLRNRVLPEIMEKAGAGTHPYRIKAWSAGCSTGEEPYSIAILLHDFLKGQRGWDFRVLASDINSEVLQAAARGVYARDKVAGIPYKLLTRYFALGSGNNENFFKVKDFLRKKVIFRNINLFREEEYPGGCDIDFLFCRNVFIYFDRLGQDRILDFFARRVNSGGYLFLGHSETIGADPGVVDKWKLVRHTVYRRSN